MTASTGEKQGPASPRRVPTIYDVARQAGVSHQTVSRLLKGGSGIRPENRERIERVLKELDYRPNLAARSLATNRSRRIGAMAYEMLETGPSKIIQGASNAAREAGYLLDVVSLDPRSRNDIEVAVSLLAQQDLAGILAFAPTDHLVEVVAESRFSVPVYVETESDDSVPGHPASPNSDGVRQLVDHLYRLGHRRFFHISGPPAWLSARNRAVAYEGALAERGLTSLGSLPGDWSAASGYEGAMRMPSELGVTAIVAANDQMALGVLRALAERGRAVPDEVSVVGMDDLPEARFYSPPLTTVQLDFENEGRLAVKSLLGLIGDPNALATPVPAPPRLVPRLSSGPVAAG
ncbi:LacI family DNA-binding transcriptional regulator [Planctomonas deserti]|uniref:LacI family DNA-binding transcriptional regulator n=1 Tax=Planctomonas deserti TaxID=2144185 RepID=UPI000D34D32C|nr:LacI family DNA-binding transcriptional regulator [Planctomonas deserti]